MALYTNVSKDVNALVVGYLNETMDIKTNRTATNITTPGPESFHRVFYGLFFDVLYGSVTPVILFILAVCGIAGNATVIATIIRKKEFRTSTTMFMASLAVADLACLILSLPFAGYVLVVPSWNIGGAACKLSAYMMDVTLYVTVYTLVAISANRLINSGYTLIRGTQDPNPANEVTDKISVGQALVASVCIWIIALLVNIPVLLKHGVHHYNDHAECTVDSSTEEILTLTFFFFGYIIPLALMIVLYRRRCLVHFSDSCSTESGNLYIYVVVTVFFVMWLPYHVDKLLSQYVYKILPTHMIYDVFYITGSCMVYGNSCINPFIYSSFDDDFSKEFNRLRDKLFCKKQCNKTSATYSQVRIEALETSKL